jgi:hypothetical protein
MFRTHCVVPRGATRYVCLPTVSRLTGVERHCPLDRPRTRRTRDPMTLTPARVSHPTSWLKIRSVRVGATYRLSASAT